MTLSATDRIECQKSTCAQVFQRADISSPGLPRCPFCGGVFLKVVYTDGLEVTVVPA